LSCLLILLAELMRQVRVLNLFDQSCLVPITRLAISVAAAK